MAMMTMTTKLGVPFSKAFQSPNQDSTPKKIHEDERERDRCEHVNYYRGLIVLQ